MAKDYDTSINVLLAHTMKDDLKEIAKRRGKKTTTAIREIFQEAIWKELGR